MVINEILAHTGPDLEDVVELYNLSSQAVDISHWCLSDKKEQPCLLTLDAGAIIPAQGFYLIPLPTGAPFRLSEMGETVTLSAATADGVLTGDSDKVKFGATPNNVSVGRVVTSDGLPHYPLMESVTLGAPNSAPLISPIVIDEILYLPETGKPQYIRVTNQSSSPQPFYHREVPDTPWEIDGIGTLTIPDEITLQPGESLWVSSGTPAETRAAYGIAESALVFGPWQGTLQPDGENIELKRPDKPDEEEETTPMVVVDAVDFLAESPWPLARAGEAIKRFTPLLLGSEPNNWFTGTLQRVHLPTVFSSQGTVQ